MVSSRSSGSVGHGGKQNKGRVRIVDFLVLATQKQQHSRKQQQQIQNTTREASKKKRRRKSPPTPSKPRHRISPGEAASALPRATGSAWACRPARQALPLIWPRRRIARPSPVSSSRSSASATPVLERRQNESRGYNRDGNAQVSQHSVRARRTLQQTSPLGKKGEHSTKKRHESGRYLYKTTAIQTYKNMTHDGGEQY